MAETDELEKEFNDWWSTDGQYLDPDTSDVPWFDKRRGLAEYAFRAARCLDGWNDDMSAAKRDGTHYLIRLEGSSPPTVAHWFEDDPKLGGTGNPGWYLSVSQFAGPPVHPIAWQHISARRPAPAGAEVGVTVKPLEWGAVSSRIFAAKGVVGLYRVKQYDDHWAAFLYGTGFNAERTTADEAKAAAQADYEARIRSALVSPPVEPQGRMCERCQGNGEIVTDWDRYKHPHPGDKGDEAVRQCPDCDGAGVAPVEPQGEREGWAFTALRKAQDVLAEYIVPDSGISDFECVNRLLGILDDKELVRRMRAAPPSPQSRKRDGHIDPDNGQWVGPLDKCNRCGGKKFEDRDGFHCCTKCGVSYGASSNFPSPQSREGTGWNDAIEAAAKVADDHAHDDETHWKAAGRDEDAKSHYLWAMQTGQAIAKAIRTLSQQER